MTAIAFGITTTLFVLLGAYGIHLIRDDGTNQYEIHDERDHESTGNGGFVRLIDALGIRTQKLLRKLYGPVRLKSLDRRLKNAGNPEGLTLDLFIQREAGFISLSILLLVIFTLLGHPIYGLLFGIVFSGWMYLWLFQAVQKRQASIDRDIPDFLDVLAITVRSGMSFRSSLERVCSHFDGPVAEEMQKTLHEMRLGVSRRDAFTATKERCRSDNIDNFVTALLQSEELGTPIGDALASIVKEIRRERAQQVRRAAAKAQPKLALVATTTMVPGAMILMLGGMIFANWETITKLFGG
ncbi:type II secretion system F family protein [Actinomyces oris]|uniref:Type II secretion system F family protein n=1 Tax=Actinomyces oris TaxID=544580 RepID=A0A1Q8WR05_9ACTO|nr:type II secretion system F family protein [Actinomyces oris]OLO70556.1 type II secretion system protein F [Actinomyces oris]QQC38970.1 type II secretion system F family protein [Actinomyces oris]TQD62220.1 type II secretion system F family protein [Actinomyces oris]